MSGTEIETEEVEVVVLLEARVDIGRVVDSRGRGSDIGQDGSAVQIT